MWQARYARSRNSTLAAVSLGAMVLMLFARCGGRAPYKTARVSAKVTYEDGSLIPGEIVTLTFFPQVEPIDPKIYPKVGMGYADQEDGSVESITTYELDDGLIVGKHKVTVESTSKLQAPTGAIPPIYTDVATTPLEIEVSGSRRQFELTIPRPR